MRTRWLVCLTMVALGLAACSDEESRPDGGGDAAKDVAPIDAPPDMILHVDADPDAQLDLGPASVYKTPGCGANAVPSVGGNPGTAGLCLGTFCSCTGQTVYGNCNWAYEPYVHTGECTGDGGAGQ